jgi:hypothetical protein
MTIAFIVALTVTITACLIVLDRKDRRHARHVERLLHYQHDPAGAALADMPAAELLYLPPEDDQAWNDHHGTGD